MLGGKNSLFLGVICSQKNILSFIFWAVSIYAFFNICSGYPLQACLPAKAGPRYSLVPRLQLRAFHCYPAAFRHFIYYQQKTKQYKNSAYNIFLIFENATYNLKIAFLT
jgi:hypothetical protein